MTPFVSTRLPIAWELWIAARLLPLFVRNKSLDELLKMATPGRAERRHTGMEAGAILRGVKKAAARPWLMRDRRCLREGLMGFHFLTLAGHKPILHFAIIVKTVTKPRPSAHCWISLDGVTVLNPPEVPMLDLFSYDGSRAVPAAFRKVTPIDG